MCDNRTMNKNLCSRKKSLKEAFYNVTLSAIVLLFIIYSIVLVWDLMKFTHGNYKAGLVRLQLQKSQSHIKLDTYNNTSRPRNPDCRIWNCINPYRCGQNGHENLTVYIYPYYEYKYPSKERISPISKEYYQMIRAISESKFYTSNPDEACLFLPSVDILNQRNIDIDLIIQIFNSLSYWNNGENHLLYHMLPNNSSFINTSDAIILSSSFTEFTYRPGFDVALPFWIIEDRNKDTNSRSQRTFTVLSSELNVASYKLDALKDIANRFPREILILRSCDTRQEIERCDSNSKRSFKYPAVLGKSLFCLLGLGMHTALPNLLEVMSYNCIPVIIADNLILPFEDVIDWSLASIKIPESEIHNLMSILLKISTFKIFELQQQVHWLYKRYLKDLTTITMTSLKIIEGRIFPHRRETILNWNVMDNFRINPLFLPLISPKSQGFTAVILTYDRVESLFTLIRKISLVSSLQSILIIWNNQRKLPPHLSTFPTIVKPIKVIQMRSNKLSNRFYPYPEIETEAILTIDDDIIMLTSDELEFGFEVWREFPDRIVGYPSRIHKWSNLTMTWGYDSEWTNKISMVLTGAAFYHKFWGHVYTNALPGNIKKWVDEHMNCEDIAMNFLVASVTNKSPIKVTPRKKFKCPECTNTEMLSADLHHMRERSFCIDRFARIFGRLPLRSVEFRADPVLFKDNFPEKLKKFNDIGNL